MKFGVWMDCSGLVRDVEAEDAEGAARAAAERDYESSGAPPSDHCYDVTVMAPDGAITRHDVQIEWDPVFSAWDSKEEPAEEAVAALRADARGAGGGT